MERPSPFSQSHPFIFIRAAAAAAVNSSPRHDALRLPHCCILSRYNRRLVLLDRDEVLEIVQISPRHPPINSSCLTHVSSSSLARFFFAIRQLVLQKLQHQYAWPVCFHACSGGCKKPWTLEVDYFKHGLHLLRFFTWHSFNHIRPSSDLQFCHLRTHRRSPLPCFEP